jgi:hypothetical protein
MQKKRWTRIGMVFVLVILAVFLFENKTRLLHRIVDEVLYTNYRHSLPCKDLPDLETVERQLNEFDSTMKQIESLSEGNVALKVDSSSCPGKGSIKIYFPSHSVRQQIEKILGGKTFHGVPLDLINW